ncbi:MAG: AfsA-related hotdog domain-containing protein [Propioniciclava sp.]
MLTARPVPGGVAAESSDVAVSPAQATLRFDQTVDRSLVHRHAIAEVFVTDATAGPDDRTFVAVQIPRGHRVNRDSERVADVLILEALRQASIYVAHTVLSVPQDMVFVFNGMALRFTDPSGLRFCGNQLSSIIDLAARTDHLPNGRPTKMQFTARLLVDGLIAVEADSEVSLVTRKAWSILCVRAGMDVSGIVEEGHAPRNIIGPIAEIVQDVRSDGRRECRAQIIVDERHPFYFDHPLDHIPAALQVDAIGELCAELLATGTSERQRPVLRSITMAFQGFAGLSSPAFAAVRLEEEAEHYGDPTSCTVIGEIRQGKSTTTVATLVYTDGEGCAND